MRPMITDAGGEAYAPSASLAAPAPVDEIVWLYYKMDATTLVV